MARKMVAIEESLWWALQERRVTAHETSMEYFVNKTLADDTGARPSEGSQV